MKTMQYEVTSSNFSWHAPIACATYADALAAAKARGFEARIEFGVAANDVGARCLVAVWSPLYGVHVYDRALAGMEPGL